MLSLDSPRWGELEHAYGSAEDVPALLVALLACPKSEGQREPWFSIWSALAHQGDVYSASFAAVPHVISVLALNPTHCDSAYFQFPAWVEICRVSKNVPVPSDLQQTYFDALASLPMLAARWAITLHTAPVSLGSQHSPALQGLPDQHDWNADRDVTRSLEQRHRESDLLAHAD